MPPCPRLSALISFQPEVREGYALSRLISGNRSGYKNLFSSRLLGTPVSAYVYQARHSNISATGSGSVTNGDSVLLSVGATEAETEMQVSFNSAISTRVTAHMGLGLKLTYALASRWQLSLGFEATHFSNGNTSFPNSGINTIGLSFREPHMYSTECGMPKHPII